MSEQRSDTRSSVRGAVALGIGSMVGAEVEWPRRLGRGLLEEAE